jgi:hypothetical protein
VFNVWWLTPAASRRGWPVFAEPSLTRHTRTDRNAVKRRRRACKLSWLRLGYLGICRA